MQSCFLLSQPDTRSVVVGSISKSLGRQGQLMARSEDLSSFPGKSIPRGMRECEYALRFGPIRIKAGHFLMLSATCPDLFYPDRVLIQADVHERFVVDALRVEDSQRKPLRTIRGEQMEAWLAGKASIEPGQTVVMEVTNTSKDDATFQCCLMGRGVVKIREKGMASTYLDRSKNPSLSRSKK
jgi:hypothetical protein